MKNKKGYWLWIFSFTSFCIMMFLHQITYVSKIPMLILLVVSIWLLTKHLPKRDVDDKTMRKRQHQFSYMILALMLLMLAVPILLYFDMHLFSIDFLIVDVRSHYYYEKKAFGIGIFWIVISTVAYIKWQNKTAIGKSDG